MVMSTVELGSKDHSAGEGNNNLSATVSVKRIAVIVEEQCNAMCTLIYQTKLQQDQAKSALKRDISFIRGKG
jgi:hypothetical protein